MVSKKYELAKHSLQAKSASFPVFVLMNSYIETQSCLFVNIKSGTGLQCQNWVVAANGSKGLGGLIV